MPTPTLTTDADCDCDCDCDQIEIWFAVDDDPVDVVAIPAAARLTAETGRDLARLAAQISVCGPGPHVVEILAPRTLAGVWDADVVLLDDGDTHVASIRRRNAPLPGPTQF